MVRYLNQKGLSLTEILVVVAIVGLLTAISTPQYQKMKRKGMQTEAKVLLSKIYSVESTFINEWKYGTPNFFQMGFYPEGQIFYNVGWPNSANVKGGNVNQTTVGSLPTGYEGPYVNKAMVSSSKQASVTNNILKKLVGTRYVCAKASTLCVSISPPRGDANYKKFGFGQWKSKRLRIDNSSAPGQVKFTIGARAYFTGSSSDEWIIDHNKVLKHAKNGI